MAKPEQRRLIPITEAARMLSIHRKTYDRWLAEDRPIPRPIEVEGELRIDLDELYEYIEDRKRERDSAIRKGGGAVPINLRRAHLPPPPER